MKLISMVDFVLEVEKGTSLQGSKLKQIVNYANFLKQHLTLGMFVPLDDDSNVLEKPEDYEKRLPNMMTEYNDEIYRYKQAKEKVLFEGFIITDETEFLISKYGFSLYFNQIEDFNIEQLLTWSNEIQLTENAIKQIGL